MVNDVRDGGTRNGNVRFYLRSTGFTLACGAAGWALIELSMLKGWWLPGFAAYILWCLGALAVPVTLAGAYVDIVNRRTLRRLAGEAGVRKDKDNTFKQNKKQCK